MGWTISTLIGVALLALAGYLAQREHAWLRAAKTTHGSVGELIAVRGNKGGYSYKPRVRYVSQDGVEREFVRPSSSNPAGFQVGESVLVAYRPETYEGRIFTFGQRYGLETVLAVVGLAILGLRLAFYIGPQFVPRLYLQQW